MGEQFEKAVSLSELTKYGRQCCKGVSHKAGPAEWRFTALGNAKRLRDEPLSGRYRIRKGRTVKIIRPKTRTATAPWYRDRVWQRSMCENGVYDDLTRDSIWESMACQKGKGTDLAIRSVIHILQELHLEKPGAIVWGRHLDVRKFFPSTPQRAVKELDRRKISEPAFLPFLEEIIDSQEDKRSPEEIDADPFGRRGTGLGSQINQLHQVSLLNGIDREVVNMVRGYLRYNDDFLLLDHAREKVDAAADLIDRRLRELGLSMTDKGGAFHASDGFYFLRKRFLLKPSGKIIIRLHPKAMAEERRTLRALKEKVRDGERTMEQVRAHYQSWVANASYAGDGPLREMDKYYTKTFRQKPVYKLKRRYLYGNYRQAPR